ncbi:MAG: hypothetical protein GY834_01120 [Bacteroidetes bacterium]|nr:hypothetical protein [Bacteroidota bacterium]
MAVIGKIRKHSGLLVIVIGVALAAFVLGDLSKTQTKQKNYIGEVNGEKISYQEYNNRYNQSLEYEKQRLGKQTLTASESFNVRQTTWNQLLYDIIMGEEFAKVGLAVTSDELFELVQGSNPHRFIVQYFANPNTGEFDASLVLNMLQNLDQMDPASIQQWLQIEQSIKADQLTQKFSNLVKSGFYTPYDFAQLEHQMQTQKTTVRLMSKQYSSIADSLITVSDSEIKDYYNDHIDDFQQLEELRDIDYVMFEVKPSLLDRIDATNEINEIYEEFKTTDDIITFVNSVSDNRYDSTFFKKGELPVQIDEPLFNAAVGTYVDAFLDNDVYYVARLMDAQVRPDSMKATHILIGYMGAQFAGPEIIRTKEEAEILADSIYDVVRRNKGKINELARTISDDPTALDNDGNTGWFPDMAMVGPFNNAILNNSINDVVITETSFGYHIIQVTGKKNYSRKIRVAIINRSIEASGQTFQDVYTEASKFAAINTTPELFENAIIEAGLNKRSVPGLRLMSNYIAGIEYPRSIIRWAFEDESEEGSISPIFDFEGKYIVAIVTNTAEKGDLPYDEVSELASRFLMNEKKFEYIQNLIGGATDVDQAALKLGLTIEEFKLNLAFPNIELYGREPTVVGEAFALSQGANSSLIKGNSGAFMMSVVDILPASEVMDLEIYKNQLQLIFESRLARNLIYLSLEETSDIEDNRYLFY